MKEVVSVSLGSSNRDHKGTLTIDGEDILIRREGYNGDEEAVINRLKELDGMVHAFGAGGYLFSFKFNNREYKLRMAKKYLKAVKHTPLVDGSGVKGSIERRCMQMVEEELQDIIETKTAMVTSAIDRYEMTKSLYDAQFKIIYGDLAFGLGIPIKIKRLGTVHLAGRLLLPIVRQFPLSWLYPTGKSQDKFTPKYKKFFDSAELIAGDFLYTKKYAPINMENKIILTNTTTAEDIDEFKHRGVKAIITTTPDVGGRSFGTNGLEAALVARSELGRALTAEEMNNLVDKAGMKPQIIRF